MKRKFVALQMFKITDHCIAQSTQFGCLWWAVLHEVALSGKYILIMAHQKYSRIVPILLFINNCGQSKYKSMPKLKLTKTGLPYLVATHTWIFNVWQVHKLGGDGGLHRKLFSKKGGGGVSYTCLEFTIDGVMYMHSKYHNSLPVCLFSLSLFLSLKRTHTLMHTPPPSLYMPFRLHNLL